MEWQTIETAPKDGTRKLLIDLEDNWPYIGIWAPHHRDVGMWVEDNTNAVPDRQPTHWMPLPSPPVSREE